MDNKRMGAKIRELRTKKEWSQMMLAEKLGYSDRAIISRIENGLIDLPTSVTKRIAELFGVSPLYFLEEGFAPGELHKTKIPIYGSIPAGIPLEAITDIEDYEEMYEMDGEFFALKVRGNSMEPKIPNGSVVIFRKQDDCESGQICAVMVNSDDATLKKVVKTEYGIILAPINEEYKPMFFDNEQIASKPVRILGVAYELRCKL